MSKHSGHFTYHYGPTPRAKVKYTYEEALAKQWELEQKFSVPLVIYLCERCGHHHVGNRMVSRRAVRDGNVIYRAFGNMVAALMRGKITPPLGQMMHQPEKDLHPPGK